MAYNSYIFKRYLILNMISHLGPISRTELIELTDYRPASVSDIIKELLDEQLIVETGHASVGHGRKRTMLEINREQLCAIGISFTDDSVNYVVSKIDGSILLHSIQKLSEVRTKQDRIDRIIDHIRSLLTQFSHKQILGIGISEPLFDPTAYQHETSLTANYSHFNDWIRLSLVPMLREKFHLQVESYSGVILPAMAEQRFGVAKGIQNFICVELSNGIGSSICCNGMPVAGAKGMAGELGHTVVEYTAGNRKLCYCGKPDCVEADTAYPALVSAIESALAQGVFSSIAPGMPITVETIREALDSKDRMCMHLVREVATRIGLVIANAVNLLNPELVVLHGFMLKLGDYFLEILKRSLEENVLTIASDYRIEISDSMETLLPLGAVAEIFSCYMHSDNYPWVYQMKPTERNGET